VVKVHDHVLEAGKQVIGERHQHGEQHEFRQRLGDQGRRTLEPGRRVERQAEQPQQICHGSEQQPRRCPVGDRRHGRDGPGELSQRQVHRALGFHIPWAIRQSVDEVQRGGFRRPPGAMSPGTWIVVAKTDKAKNQAYSNRFQTGRGRSPTELRIDNPRGRK
jgi:hypothetical protein